MKKTKILFSALLLFGVFVSCENDSTETETLDSEFAEVENLLTNAGFEVEGLVTGAMGGVSGYVVEGDIFLTVEQIRDLAPRVSVDTDTELQTEHYRTRNLVNGPREIRVFQNTGFRRNARRAFNRALRRYNNLGLELTFRRVSNRNNADIVIDLEDLPPGVLGRSGGFPTAAGNPASRIVLARSIFSGTNVPADTPTVIAHEIGHAIGLRHTDLFNRSFSCGGRPVNEGDGGVGAIFIPGTPDGPEAGSYMLACSNGTDRPFTRGDRRALRRTY